MSYSECSHDVEDDGEMMQQTEVTQGSSAECGGCGRRISMGPQGWVHEDSDQRSCERAEPATSEDERDYYARRKQFVCPTCSTHHRDAKWPYQPEPDAAGDANPTASALPTDEPFTLYYDDEGDFVIQANRAHIGQHLTAHGDTPNEAVQRMCSLIQLLPEAQRYTSAFAPHSRDQSAPRNSALEDALQSYEHMKSIAQTTSEQLSNLRESHRKLEDAAKEMAEALDDEGSFYARMDLVHQSQHHRCLCADCRKNRCVAALARFRALRGE